jgi:hypothetical protein
LSATTARVAGGMGIVLDDDERRKKGCGTDF